MVFDWFEVGLRWFEHGFNKVCGLSMVWAWFLIGLSLVCAWFECSMWFEHGF
jgi:hypothetical protein